MITITDAKQALYDLFAERDTGRPVESLLYVERVYLGEPRPGEAVAPISIAISVASGDPLEMNLVVNVYASPDADATGVQTMLDETNDTVLELLAASATFGRGTWSTQYLPTVDVFVSSHQVQVGREDF